MNPRDRAHSDQTRTQTQATHILVCQCPRESATMHIILFTTLALLGSLSAADSSEKDNESWVKDAMFPCTNNFNFRSKECAERGISEGNVGQWPRFDIKTESGGMKYKCRERFFSGDPVTKYSTEYLDKESGLGTGRYTYQQTVCDYATEMNAHCQPLNTTSLFEYDTWVTYNDRKDSYPDIDSSNNGEPWFSPGYKKECTYENFIDRSVTYSVIAADPHVDCVDEKDESGEKWIVCTCADGYTGAESKVLHSDLSDYTLQYIYDWPDRTMIFKLDFVNWVVENTDCQPE